MKKLFTLILIGVAFYGHTQNTFPATGNVGIGTLNPTCAIDVAGTGHVTGEFIVDQNLRVFGKTFLHDSLISFRRGVFQDGIAIGRIAPLPGDSLIRFGNNTLLFNSGANRISTTPSGIFGGLGIGVGASGLGNNSFALGNASTAREDESLTLGWKVSNANTATRSISMGTGGTGTFLTNTTSNSLVIGFNSDVPTMYVGPASGNGQTGNVAIGTVTPATNVQFQIETNKQVAQY